MLRAITLRRFAGAGLALALVWGGATISAQTIEAPYDTDYTLVDLGAVPGLASPYGGLTFLAGDPSTLLIGGDANSGFAAVHSIAVVRDAGQHVIGFAGSATAVASAPHMDGGLAYGPEDTLFFTRWPNGDLGQIPAGSSTTDRVVDLVPLGVSPSPGGLNFVPDGFPGAGGLKVVSYDTGDWYTVTLSPEGAGTFDAMSANAGPTLDGGPEGFIYVPPGSPQFDDFGWMLVSEWNAGSIAAYELDANGDPLVGTRVDFARDVLGALGATVDPLTGDFLFSTFLGGDAQVFTVRGFAPPDGGSCESPQPVGHGYWHRQCMGTPQSDGGLSPGNGNGPNGTNESGFAEQVLPCATEMLDSLGLSSSACEAISPWPASDRCERAERDLATLVFNVCSERISTSCPLDGEPGSCSAETVGELLEETADLIVSGSCRDAGNCARAPRAKLVAIEGSSGGSKKLSRR